MSQQATNKQGIFKRRPLVLAIGLVVSLPLSAQQTMVLEEVIVTAQKRSESLQSVPVTVNAVTAETLERNQVLSFDEVGKLVPGVELSNNSPTYQLVSMRGISNDPFAASASPMTIYWNEQEVRSPGVITESGV